MRGRDICIHTYHTGKLARLINAAEPADALNAPNDVNLGPFRGGVKLQFDELTRYVEEYDDQHGQGGNLHHVDITRRDIQDPSYPPAHRPIRELDLPVARTADWFACDFVSTNFVYSRVDKLLDDRKNHRVGRRSDAFPPQRFDPWTDFRWPEVTLSLGIFTSGGLAYPAGIVHDLLSLETFITKKRPVQPRELFECFRWV